MKLNNKGFAITSVLYGLLILFVVFTGTYLSLLGAKKNKLDKITADIEKKYDFNEMSKAIHDLFKSLIGMTPKVIVVPIGTLPRSEKKTKRVIDYRNL